MPNTTLAKPGVGNRVCRDEEQSGGSGVIRDGILTSPFKLRAGGDNEPIIAYLLAVLHLLWTVVVRVYLPWTTTV